jgi:hypothetical protein
VLSRQGAYHARNVTICIKFTNFLPSGNLLSLKRLQ